MSIWIRKGTDAIRLDGLRLFGRPPVLAPPAWAVCERVWAGTGMPAPDGPAPDLMAGAEALVSAVPANARRIVLVVPDGTRPGRWQDFLPLVVDRLRLRFGPDGGRNAPIPRRSLLVAGGVHAPLTAETLRAHLSGSNVKGSNPLEGWAVSQNGDNAFRDHEEVGRTPAGTVVRLHPEYVRADWRILLGDISYHYFAGFGGGRKLVFPGLGEPAGIVMNHRRALRRLRPGTETSSDSLADWSWNEQCGPGRLAGNPVHQDLDSAARLASPHWVATLVEDPPTAPDPASPGRFPVTVVQGPYPAALDEAAVAYEKRRRIAFTVAPSLLIADAGGGPRDATFLQAHKSLQHAARFVPRGARVLLAASCDQGLGSATLARYATDPGGFRPFAHGGEDAMSVIHLQTLIALQRVASTRRVGLWSDLPDPTVRGLGLEPLPDRDAALAWCAAETIPAWGWLPRAERFLPASGWMGGGVGGSV